MAKTNRGKVLRTEPGCARGTCPVCGRTGIKLRWEATRGEEKIKVCKRCRTKE